MSSNNFETGKLIKPSDLTSSSASRKMQDVLVPPSHFASGQPSGVPTGVNTPGMLPSVPWLNLSLTSAPLKDLSPASQCPAVTQANQEMSKENHRIRILLEDSPRGRTPVDQQSDFRARSRSTEQSERWSRRDSEWHQEALRQMAMAERLKGQVEALKETSARYREEMRDKDSRQNHDLEAMHEELCKAKTELIQIREELTHSIKQKETISSQLESLKRESGEEIAKMRGDVERSKEEARELTQKAEMGWLQAEEAKMQISRLSAQLGEMQKEQEVELEQLKASHSTELGAAAKSSSELRKRLESTTSEVLQLKSILTEVSAERDGLKEQLSKMGQAFETQSATLHSLRNYIGQLVPEKEEKEQLNEAIERLSKEKAALQRTTELLTVRLNSANEILSLQEEKMLQTSRDPLMKNGSESHNVLQLWRDKVFKLCVQLRSKDIELRGEREKLLSKVRCIEQLLQQEKHQASVLQHSLDARSAELNLEKVEKESLKQDLAQAHKENLQLKSQSHKAEAELKTLAQAAQRFSLAFEGKMAEVDAAQGKLNASTLRLTFAKRRVEMIQGLIMRKEALQNAKQASKWAEQATARNLQTEHSLVCEERDKLTQELKRTPELIGKALADLQEQYENKLRQKEEELEQSSMALQQAVAGREQDQRSLQESLAQLEESKVSLDELHSELLSQQQRSERALQERVSEIEAGCSEKLREMEIQLKTTRRKHNKAVKTLLQFEREAERKLRHMREPQDLQSELTKTEVQNKQPKDTEKIRTLPLASVAERDLLRAPMTALPNFAPGDQQETPPERSRAAGANVKAHAERHFSFLDELSILNAAVLKSFEDSAEEEEEDEEEEG